MARNYNPQDAHAIMNLLVSEATGTTSANVVDTSTFISAGETLANLGYNTVLTSLSNVIGRLIAAVRPYKGSMALIQAENNDLYTSIVRKLSFFRKDALPSGAWNTNLFTNLYNGYDNGSNDGKSVESMWKQDKPAVIETKFGGQSVWDVCLTVYKMQLKTAFRNENEFMALVEGIMIQKRNEIVMQKEAFNRMIVLNMIASAYDVRANGHGNVVNLTKAFNDRFGTSYTSQELRSTYLKEFLAFFVATFKIVSKNMVRNDNMYHVSPSVTIDGVEYSNLDRHTSYDNQRVILYSPLFVEAEAMVLPQIFNPKYLNVETQYEDVTFWQSSNEPSRINVTPAIPDYSTGQQKAGEPVDIPYVVGIIYDKDAMVVSHQFEGAETTPVEARKKYYNTWWSFSKNGLNDVTEKHCIFIMQDEV